MSSGSPSTQPSSAPRARISTLGRFVIELEGQPLRFDGKQPLRPLALLKTLIALGGHSVPVEQLCESVWPQFDGDRAHSAFKSALSRLRKLIGSDALIQEGQRLSISPSACWVDTQAFTAHLKAALEALEGGQPQAAVTEMDAAVRLYAGPFLEGEFDPPEVIGARERLHGLFSRHLATVADTLLERGDAAPAARLYRLGLESDDLAEDFCRGLMHCLRASGQVADALSTYRRYQQVLSARMGLEPSPELTALYQEIAATAGGAVEPAQVPPGTAPTAAQSPSPSLSTGAQHPLEPHTEPVATGERRSITVLELRVPGIADVIGSGDPEDAEAVVRSLWAWIEAIVQRHGGVVNQLLRDEMFACFGIPVAREDHARAAAAAALEVCRGLREQVVPGVEGSGRLECHAGIDSGVVVVKASRDSFGRYAITGSPVERAGRLARRAAPGALLVSMDTLRLIAPYFETEPARIPGPRRDSAGQASEPLTAHQVLRETAVQTRFDASTVRGLTTFVGRQRELGDLREALDKADGEQGQCVAILGEAGIGKSRLVYQFCHELEPARYHLLQGRCQAGAEHTPYLPWGDLLQRWFELNPTAPQHEQVERVARCVMGIRPELERYIPVLLRLLALESEQHQLPPALTGDDLRAAIREALGVLLTEQAQHRTVVLVLEDWHWVDDASEAALRYVLGVIPSAPLLILVTRRPEGEHTWPQLSYVRQQALQPLDGETSAQVARHALRAKELPDGMERLVHERTGGNPLFIEEMVNNLLEEGTVRVQRGVARITSLAIEPRLPDTVEAVVRSRVDRLDGSAREVLQLASVAGQEFTLGLLNRVHAEPESLAAGLERLKGQELIRQVRMLPEPTYQFNHAITQTVVYGTLLRDRRREMHALMGEAIEAAHEGRLDEQAERLLEHCVRAEQWARAAHYARRSGEKAQALSQFAQAVRFYEQGVGHLERLGEALTPEQQTERIDLQLEACFCRINLGRFSEAIAAGERIEPDVEAGAEAAHRVRLRVMFGTCAMYRGDREACERYLLPALEFPELQGDDLTLANCKHVLAGCYVGQGLWSLAAPYLEEALRIYERLRLEEAYLYGYFALPYVVGCAQLGIVRAFQGHVQEATELFRKGRPFALGPAANFATKGVFLSWAGVFSALVGDDRLGLQSNVQEILHNAERSDSPFLLLAGRLLQSNLLIAQGRMEEARTFTEATLDALGATPLRTGHLANLHYNRVMTDLSRGDVRAAQAHAEEMNSFREISPHWFGPRTDMVGGVLADLQGDTLQARTLLERSIAADLEAGAEVLADQTRYRLALVLAQDGEEAQARAQLEQLRERFGQRDMPAWERMCGRALERGASRRPRRRERRAASTT